MKKSRFSDASFYKWRAKFGGMDVPDRLLAAKLDAPVHDIILTDDLNAAAYVVPGLVPGLGARRKLMLGVPLMRLLDADELKAVIAHELGCFSRKHSHMGHWLYRIRIKWA